MVVQEFWSSNQLIKYQRKFKNLATGLKEAGNLQAPVKHTGIIDGTAATHPSNAAQMMCCRELTKKVEGQSRVRAQIPTCAPDPRCGA